MKEHIVEIGYDDVVIVDKLYGPTIFANLRVRQDRDRCEWIIERQWIKTGEWIEWCRMPAQIEQEFTEEPQPEEAKAKLTVQDYEKAIDDMAARISAGEEPGYGAARLALSGIKVKAAEAAAVRAAT